jgi:hypothetical protein
MIIGVNGSGSHTRATRLSVSSLLVAGSAASKATLDVSMPLR